MTLIITKEDEAMFERLAQKRFIKELYQYCQSTLPHWTKIMGDESVSTALDWFMDKTTNTLGLEKRASHYLYLGTSLFLGGLFYKDIQYQPLIETFNDNYYLIESERIKKLYQSITNYEQGVIGENKERLQIAVEELGRFEALRLNADNFDSDILTILKHFYPEKVEYIDSEHYRAFIDWGKTRAQNSYALTPPNQWATYIMLMFYLGQHFDNEPFLIWFDWPQRLQEVQQNQFSFETLPEQLLMIWR